jgi:hypothetical protein
MSWSIQRNSRSDTALQSATCYHQLPSVHGDVVLERTHQCADKSGCSVQKLLLTPEREVSLMPLLMLRHMFGHVLHRQLGMRCIFMLQQTPVNILQKTPDVAQVLVELVITRDSGEIETFNAYRVQHDNRCQTSSRP